MTLETLKRILLTMMLQGTDSSLECVTTGQPPPRVTWYRISLGGQREVMRAAGGRDRDQRLELTNITRDHEGLYR